MHNPRPSGAARRRQQITEQAARWYLDLREGLDEEERAAFLAWLKTSPGHVAEYLAIAGLHGDLKHATALDPLSVDALGTLACADHAVVSLHPPARVEPPTRRERQAPMARHRRGRWLAVAGVALAMLGGTATWRRAPSPKAKVYASGSAQGLPVDLPDGSLLQLDRDSAIAVRFDARQRDLTLLRGTAMISVGKDPARPLQVTLGAVTLRDIGTVFEVARRSDGGSVTVISGQVDLIAPAPPIWSMARWLHPHLSTDRVIAALRRGEQATVDAHGRLTAPVANADIGRATAWLPGEIRFQQSTVAEVATRFNAYTARPLVIDDPVLAAMRISGRFRARDMGALVAYLGTFPGIRVQADQNAIHVLGGTPPSPKRTRL